MQLLGTCMTCERRNIEMLPLKDRPCRQPKQGSCTSSTNHPDTVHGAQTAKVLKQAKLLHATLSATKHMLHLPQLLAVAGQACSPVHAAGAIQQHMKHNSIPIAAATGKMTGSTHPQTAGKQQAQLIYQNTVLMRKHTFTLTSPLNTQRSWPTYA